MTVRTAKMWKPNRAAYQDSFVRKGQQKEVSRDKTARTGQSEMNSPNRINKIGQSYPSFEHPLSSLCVSLYPALYSFIHPSSIRKYRLRFRKIYVGERKKY
jgi:hypothetical protein